MRNIRRTFLLAIGAGLLFAAPQAAPAAAQELTKAEKIYAALAKLPPKERTARIMEGAKKEGEVHLIRSLRGKLGKGRITLFRKRYPWLKVNESELGSQDAAYRMVAEETAGRHLTDVVSIAAADMLELLGKNVAARYETPVTKKVLPQYRAFLDDQHRWVAWGINEHGIVYNTNLVKNPPKTYMELCDSRFKGKISFEPAETRFLSAMYNVMGKDLGKMEKWIKCIAANKPLIQRGHTGRLRLMLSGDHAITPDQYIYRGTSMKLKNAKVPFAANYQTPVMIWALTNVINKNTPRPYATALFVDWTLSAEGQGYLAKKFRGPIALKHPYFPKDTKFVPFVALEKKTVDKLHKMWAANIRKQ